ncbi:MAG TPA: hypothetical protein VN600_05475 [Gemmatimonadaceae bacterium]|nr:hypothetical protein [Gemmatimonadaceae bacterium]
MPLQPDRRLERHWLFTVFAAIAIVAQLVVAFAPLTEGRYARMGSHVESTGSRTHVLHDDATCAACQARSIQGTTAPATVPVALVTLAPRDIVGAADHDGSTDPNLQQNPRAPPRVI